MLHDQRSSNSVGFPSRIWWGSIKHLDCGSCPWKSFRNVLQHFRNNVHNIAGRERQVSSLAHGKVSATPVNVFVIIYKEPDLYLQFR